MPRNPFDNGGDEMVVTPNTAGSLTGAMSTTNPRTPVVFVGPDGAEYVSYQTEVKVHGHGGISEPVMLVKLVPLDSSE